MRWTQYLEVSLDVRQKGNVAETGNDEHQERDSENEDGESRRHSKGRSEEVAIEVLLDIPPSIALVLFGEVERVQCQGIDGLTRTVGEEQALPALESEEDEESKVVNALGGGRNVVEEAEMVV